MNEYKFLADWVRNTIDKCEVVSRCANGNHGVFEVKTIRFQLNHFYTKSADSLSQKRVLDTYQEARAWIKERRQAQIDRIKGQLKIAEAKMAENVIYYE